MQKLVISFSDANAAGIVQGLDFEAMGRKMLKRYIRIAAYLLDQIPKIVVFEDDKGPSRPVFSGNPNPTVPEKRNFTFMSQFGVMHVPTLKYYSNDLRGSVHKMRIPFPEGTTAEMVYNAISQERVVGHLVRMQGDTVFLQPDR